MKAMLLRLLFIFFLCFGLSSACNSSESGISIKGKIINLDNYNLKYLNQSFIQLVALNPESQKLEVIEITVIKGIDGNTLGVNYVSEFPKLEVPKDGEFKYRIKDLKPGRYIIVIQELPLNRPTGYFGPGPLMISRPLGKGKNKINVIEISEKDKPPYSINLGEVFIAYSDKYIIGEFDDAIFLRP